MTRYGLETIKHHMEKGSKKSSSQRRLEKFELPDDILKELETDPILWKNFLKFPESYKRIRIGWIDDARRRPDEFRKRLRYFMKMTAKNKKFGMVQ